jgi:hypothetical protein
MPRHAMPRHAAVVDLLAGLVVLTAVFPLLHPPLQAKGARLVSITSVPGSPLEEVRLLGSVACTACCLDWIALSWRHVWSSG